MFRVPEKWYGENKPGKKTMQITLTIPVFRLPKTEERIGPKKKEIAYKGSCRKCT